jgi:ABC-type dipeptide/oligopeptide/nickel transport system ATPase component
VTGAAAAAAQGDVVLSLAGLGIDERATGSAIVSDVSLQLRRGRAIGIIGESGSGKTLTCRAILGLLPAGLRLASGTVEVLGRDTSSFSRKDWSEAHGAVISAVFQDPASYLNPAIRVGRQVEEILRVKKRLPRRQARERVFALFGAVHLRDPELVFEQYPRELSGGMVQRVLLAAAIALDPVILIADEATTALDVTVQAEILDLLSELQRKNGLSLVVVSHDLAVVEQLCDDVVVMKAGKVVDAGPVTEVLDRPRHPYTQLLTTEHRAYGLDRYLAGGAAGGVDHAD